MESEWAFQWLTDWRDVWGDSFLSDWRDLYAFSPGAHPMVAPETLQAWHHFAREHVHVEPRFAVGSHSSGARALMPMVRIRHNWKRFRYRVLEPAGSSDLDYHDPLLGPEESPSLRAELWTALLAETLRRWGRDVDEVSVHGIRTPAGAPAGFTAYSNLPYVELGPSPDSEDWLARVRPAFRKELRRTQRRLAEVGDVSFEVFQADQMARAMETLDTFFQAYRGHWKSWDGKLRLWRELVSHCLPAGLLMFSVLRVGECPASWRLGFAGRQRYHDWNASYDREMAAFGPGHVHILHLCQACADRGLALYDFMKGDEPYKLKWATGQAQLYRLGVPGASLVSRLRRAGRNVSLAASKRLRRRTGGKA